MEHMGEQCESTSVDSNVVPVHRPKGSELECGFHHRKTRVSGPEYLPEPL